MENAIVKKRDCDYILSALQGKNRSKTNQKHRGKGMKEIYDYAKENKLNNFFVLSGKGTYTVVNGHGNHSESNSELRGTIYYWEIAK
jgi:hypothetical protein